MADEQPTFIKVMEERVVKGRRCWVAIWRTPQGNFIHDRLPMGITEHKAEEAVEYTLAHVPVWGRPVKLT